MSPFSSEMAEEGTGSTTFMYSGTSKTVPLDESHFALTYQNKGVMVNDSGEGYNVGTIYFENGVGKVLGYITCIDPEGDKVLIEIKYDNT